MVTETKPYLILPLPRIKLFENKIKYIGYYYYYYVSIRETSRWKIYLTKSPALPQLKILHQKPSPSWKPTANSLHDAVRLVDQSWLKVCTVQTNIFSRMSLFTVNAIHTKVFMASNTIVCRLLTLFWFLVSDYCPFVRQCPIRIREYLSIWFVRPLTIWPVFIFNLKLWKLNVLWRPE